MGNVVADKGASPKVDERNANLQDKDVSDDDKFNLQKRLGDIAAKKEQEEIVQLSRETIRLIRVSVYHMLKVGIFTLRFSYLTR